MSAALASLPRSPARVPVARPASAGRAGDADDLRRLVAESVRGGAARHGAWLDLAGLPPEWTKPHHRRLARAALEPLLLADRARLFELADGDLVVVWRGTDEGRLRACRRAIELLFSDSAEADPAALLGVFALPTNAADLLRRLEGPAAVAAAEAPRLPAMDAGMLARLETRLARADMARFVRRRDVCAIDADGQLSLLWERRFLHLDELAATVAPGFDLRGDPWLFRRLTRTLDRRMLALLAADGELRGAGPFAIALNVGSILAPDFLRFDAALPRVLRGRVVVALDAPDILADPTAFALARDFAQARGYRVALSGIDAALLPVLSAAAGAVDLLEVRWSAALAASPLDGLDPARLVLSDATGPEALAWAVARGIPAVEGEGIVAALRRPARPWRSHGGYARGGKSQKLALGGIAAAP